MQLLATAQKVDLFNCVTYFKWYLLFGEQMYSNFQCTHKHGHVFRNLCSLKMHKMSTCQLYLTTCCCLFLSPLPSKKHDIFLLSYIHVHVQSMYGLSIILEFKTQTLSCFSLFIF